MKLTIVIWCLALSFISNAQNVFTLIEAQAYGIEHHESVENANIDLKIAQKKIRETKGIGLPQFSGSIGFNNFLHIPTTVVPAKTFDPMALEGEVAELKFGTKYTADAGVQLSQILFNGNYLVGLQASKAYANTSKVLIQKSKLNVKQDIADAYYTVLMLQNNIVSLNDSYNNMSDLLKRTQILVDEHMIESVQAAQLQLTILQIQDVISSVEAQVEIAKNLLKMNMGLDLEQEISLSQPLDDFLNLKLLVLDSFNPNNHIDYKILESQKKLNLLNLKNKKANYWPTVTAFLSHKQSAQRDKFNFASSDKSWYPTTVWGANIAIPIYSGGMYKAQVDQAELEIIKTTNTMKQADRGLRLQMKQAETNYNNAVTNYNTQIKAIEVAKLILDNTVTKYKLGSILSLELTQMESQYINTKAALNTATYNVVKAIQQIDNINNN